MVKSSQKSDSFAASVYSVSYLTSEGLSPSEIEIGQVLERYYLPAMSVAEACLKLYEVLLY